MKLRTLSATSADVYEKCPARWKVTYTGDRAQDVGNTSAADIGTACHEALEHFVLMRSFSDDNKGPTLQDLLGLFDAAYWKLFTDRARYDEGVEMVSNWHARMDWTGRTVLSTEVKDHFDLPTSLGPLKVNYIWDRCDRLDDGTIDVVDIKTVSQPVQPGDLKDRIQPRLYALAAQIKYPQAPQIRVTYDLLRFDQVGTVFTRDDNVATWKYLRSLAERIIADTSAKERLNPDCRWCIRRGVCDSLRKHIAVGGALALDDVQVAIDRRRELVDLKAGVSRVLDDIDDFIIDWARENETTSFDTGETTMEITARATRNIDAERVAKVIGPDLVARYGDLKMAAVDKLLKGGELSDDQKTELRGLITRSFGSASVKTKARPVHEVNA